MDLYKDSVEETKDYQFYNLNIQRVREMCEEEDEEVSIKQLPEKLKEEIDSIIQGLSSSSISDITEAANRLLYFSRCNEQDIYQIIFENDLINGLNAVFLTGVRMPVLNFISNMVKSTDEVVIQFIGTELFNTLVQMIYEGEPETMKFITLIFVNIIEKSTFVSCVIYCQGFLQEAADYIKENGMNNPYMEFFLSNICISLTKMRCPRNELDLIIELRAELEENMEIKLDDFNFNDYVQNGISLQVTSPIYAIINHILNTENINPKISVGAIYALNILLQDYDTVGLNSSEICNVILYDLKFVQRVVDFVQSSYNDLVDATMRLIASINFVKSSIDKFIAEVFMEAVIVTIESDDLSIQKMSIYILGGLAANASDFASLVSKDDLWRLIRVMINAPFKVRHNAIYTILQIEVALKTLEFHTFDMLTQIADFISSGIFVTEQFLSVLKDLIVIDQEKGNGEANFMHNIVDSGILEAIQDLLDSSNEKLAAMAEQFLNFYSDHDLENLDLDIDL